MDIITVNIYFNTFESLSCIPLAVIANCRYSSKLCNGFTHKE